VYRLLVQRQLSLFHLMLRSVQVVCSQQRNPTMPYRQMMDLVDSAHTSHRRAIHWVRM